MAVCCRGFFFTKLPSHTTLRRIPLLSQLAQRPALSLLLIVVVENLRNKALEDVSVTVAFWYGGLVRGARTKHAETDKIRAAIVPQAPDLGVLWWTLDDKSLRLGGSSTCKSLFSEIEQSLCSRAMR